jgi:hypothetical protein
MLVIVLSYALLFTTKIHMIQVPDKAQQGDQKQQLREIQKKGKVECVVSETVI